MKEDKEFWFFLSCLMVLLVLLITGGFIFEMYEAHLVAKCMNTARPAIECALIGSNL